MAERQTVNDILRGQPSKEALAQDIIALLEELDEAQAKLLERDPADLQRAVQAERLLAEAERREKRLRESLNYALDKVRQAEAERSHRATSNPGIVTKRLMEARAILCNALADPHEAEPTEEGRDA